MKHERKTSSSEEVVEGQVVEEEAAAYHSRRVPAKTEAMQSLRKVAGVSV
jgi:hypothetical protein